MNIAFFGSSLVSAYWNGAATYYRGIVRALHSLGHGIVFYEPDAYDRQRHRDMPDPEWASVTVYKAEQSALDECLQRAASADLVVKASGVGVFDEYLEREVLSLQGPKTSVIYWDVDAPATLERIEADPADPMRENIPRYDMILTYGGGEPVRRAFLKLGAKACEPVYNGFDPETHYPVKPDARFAGDFGFLGNRLPDREARVEAFFLAPAAAIPFRKFLVGGAGWQDKPMPANVAKLGHVYTSDHNAFNCTLLAVLNINRDSMARFGHSPATRVFEAAGAGACMVTDSFEGLENFFEPGVEILSAESGAEVIAILNGLDQAMARKIGQAALRRALVEHTYINRARRLDRLVEGMGKEV